MTSGGTSERIARSFSRRLYTAAGERSDEPAPGGVLEAIGHLIAVSLDGGALRCMVTRRDPR